MTRILVLSFYYPPDLSAGSFRSIAVVDALSRLAPAGTEIDVVTTMPNRYISFVDNAPEFAKDHNVSIRRIALPAHRSDMLGQSKAFASFARHALRAVSGRSYDLIFATSSRLMTATLGAWIARRQRCALYLDIRDIFVDTIRDVLPKPLAWPAAMFFSVVENWTMRRANRINLVSRGFEEYFRRRYPGRALSWHTNGIDDEFVGCELPDTKRKPGCTTILYAGNIGDGQGLHQVLPPLARALGGQARFIVIGDGGRRPQLESAIADEQLTNIELRPPIPRTELLAAYQSSDVLFLHLGTHPAFKKVLPSKLFEYAAVGKPILAGVAGYPAQFIRTEIDNAAVFPPCDVSAAVSAFESLRLEQTERQVFVEKYARANIVGRMAQEILELRDCLQ